MQNDNLKFKILFIGRLEEDTGLLQYFKVIKYLQEKNLSLEFELLGDGVLREEAGKLGRVHGFVKNIKSYLTQTRFVFTSSYLSILEAMAQKKLVFAAFDNPLKEDYLKMMPSAKWMIIEKDPQILAEKIKYYLTHPEEEKKLVEAAYQWVRGQTWEKVVEIYLKLWQK